MMQVNFGYIYGVGGVGCVSLWVVMTLMYDKGLDFWQVSVNRLQFVSACAVCSSSLPAIRVVSGTAGRVLMAQR